MALDVFTQAASPRWELYRVLSEPVRLRLLALAAEEELAIGELAELLGESQPNVSRHAGPLKATGLLAVRREGTRALVRLAEGVEGDAVVLDALASGRALCQADGSLRRVAEVVRERDTVGREFFARPRQIAADAPSDALPAYVAALASLLPHRSLAVDAGTGDGGLLDLLAPSFRRVIAIDRSEAQLERARARVAARGFHNVELYPGEVGDEGIVAKVSGRADVVFAARILHHAPRPAEMVKRLTELCRPEATGEAGERGPAQGQGGALLLLDYGAHDDEGMRAEGDVWLGFEDRELLGFARAAGLEDVTLAPIPAPFCGRGTDAHLPWKLLAGKRGVRAKGRPRGVPRNG